MKYGKKIIFAVMAVLYGIALLASHVPSMYREYSAGVPLKTSYVRAEVKECKGQCPPLQNISMARGMRSNHYESIAALVRPPVLTLFYWVFAVIVLSCVVRGFTRIFVHKQLQPVLCLWRI